MNNRIIMFVRKMSFDTYTRTLSMLQKQHCEYNLIKGYKGHSLKNYTLKLVSPKYNTGIF